MMRKAAARPMAPLLVLAVALISGKLVVYSSPDSSSTTVMQSWCYDSLPAVASAQLVGAADACLGSSLSQAATCTSCQCHIQAILQPAALAWQQRQVHNRTAFTPNAPPSLAVTNQLLAACLPVIVGLWSRLPGITQVAATTALRNCTWDTTLPPAACSPAAVPSTTGRQTSVASDAAAADDLGQEVAWQALCACQPSNDTSTSLCDPNTLLHYESPCHAKCRGLQDVTPLVPCTSLFTTGPFLALNITAPALSNITTPGPTNPTAAGDTQRLPTAPNPVASNATQPHNTTTGTPAGVHAPENDTPEGVDLLTYYDYDVRTCVAGGDCGPAPATATVTQRVSQDLQDAVIEHTANATSSASGQDSSPAGSGTAPVSQSGSPPSDTGSGAPVPMCPPQALQLLTGLGADSLAALMSDCDTAQCVFKALGDISADPQDPSATTNTGTPVTPTEVTGCLSQIARLLLQASGSTGVQWVRSCAAKARQTAASAPAPPEPNCAALLPPDVVTAALSRAVVVGNSTVASQNPTVQSATDTAPTLNSTLPTSTVTTTPTGNSTDLSRWLDIIRTGVSNGSVTVGVAAAPSGGGGGGVISLRPALDPTLDKVLHNATFWTFLSPTAVNAANSTAAGVPGEVVTAAQDMQQATSGQAAGGDGTVAWRPSCSCDKEYAPVCRFSDLKWYPSSCYAVCQGVPSSQLGPCYRPGDEYNAPPVLDFPVYYYYDGYGTSA